MSVFDPARTLEGDRTMVLAPGSITRPLPQTGALPRARQDQPQDDVARVLALKGLSLPGYYDSRRHAALNRAVLQWPDLMARPGTSVRGR